MPVERNVQRKPGTAGVTPAVPASDGVQSRGYSGPNRR